MTENAVAMYDFRMNQEYATQPEIVAQLRKIAKRWVFQLEKGETTGYMHWQGRMSLRDRHRLGELKKMFNMIPLPNYLQPTSAPTQLKGDFFYVMKEETRVEGPWDERNTVEKYIPRQYRGLMDKLYPYQKQIYECAKDFDSRTINLIYCEKGNQGKSTIAALCELFGKGEDLPPVNDAEKLVQTMCDICIAKNIRDPSPVFFDLPRALDKSRLYGMYSAIEQIKKGKLYDTRYRYQDYWIDSPQIWVFTNIRPDLDLLSRDRWKIWTIDTDKNLVSYGWQGN